MNKAMHTVANDSYLKIAIQTVLHHYKDRLHSIDENEEQLYRELAEQIQTQAIQFRQVAEHTLGQLERK